MENKKAKKTLGLRMRAITCVCRSDTCVRRHRPAHAARVSKTYERQVFYINVEVWNEFHIIWEPFQTPIFSLYKAIMAPFQNTQKILRENLRFTKNSESKREFFTKHP